MKFSVKVQFFSLVAMAVVLCSADTATAQRGGQRGGGFFGGGNGVADLLRSDANRKLGDVSGDQGAELDLVFEEGDEARNEYFGSIREKFRDRDADRGALMQEVRDHFAKQQVEMEEKIKSILLDHQYAFYERMSLQRKIKRDPMGALEAFYSKEKVSEADQEKIKAELEKNQKELAKKVAKLTRQMFFNSHRSVLNSSQMAALEDLVGDQIDEPVPSNQGFRGGWGGQQRGGDRGGRGGDRGGRGGDRGEEQRKGNDF